jgi:arsenite methyltransferase
MLISNRDGNVTTNKPGMLLHVEWGYYSVRSDQIFTSLFPNILNAEASSAKSKPIKIIESLNISDRDVIADIGSVGGYFALALARKAGKKGRVYAADMKPQYLAFIRRQAARERLDTISYVLGEGVALDLPEAGVDLVFVRKVLHHLPAPTDYLGVLKDI